MTKYLNCSCESKKTLGAAKGRAHVEAEKCTCSRHEGRGKKLKKVGEFSAISIY